MQSRRALMMGQKKSRLPKEYQEVEYLESTGTQWINTNLYADQNFSINLTFQAVVSGGPQMFFGARDNGTGSYANSFIGGIATSGYFYGQFGTNGTTLSTVYSDTNKHVYFMSRDGWYLDTVMFRTFDQSAFKGRYPVLVFAGSNGEYTNYSHCRVFDLLLSSAGVPILNLIPCYRKSDNKPGMYDLCGSICPLTNSPFYVNAGTGEFLVGPEV